MIRLVAGEAESPWPGALVCTPDGVTAVAVDAALLGRDWAGWDADPSGHVLAPIDILRRQDGHDVLFPVCTERLEDFLHRRAGGGELAVGEAVTVVVSLLRGIAELSSTAVGARGVWWLTDAGRPVAATDTGTASLDEQTAAHIRAVATEVPSLAHILEDAAETLTDSRRRARELERAEAAIFAIADPARAGHDHIRPPARPSSQLRRTRVWMRRKQSRFLRRGRTPCRAISMRNGRIWSRGPRPGSGAPCERLARDGGDPGSSRAGSPAWSSPAGCCGPRAAGDPRRPRCRRGRRPQRLRARHPLLPNPSSIHLSRAARNPTWALSPPSCSAPGPRAPEIRHVSSRCSRPSMLRFRAASSI